MVVVVGYRNKALKGMNAIILPSVEGRLGSLALVSNQSTTSKTLILNLLNTA